MFAWFFLLVNNNNYYLVLHSLFPYFLLCRRYRRLRRLIAAVIITIGIIFNVILVIFPLLAPSSYCSSRMIITSPRIGLQQLSLVGRRRLQRRIEASILPPSKANDGVLKSPLPLLYRQCCNCIFPNDHLRNLNRCEEAGVD